MFGMIKSKLAQFKSLFIVAAIAMVIITVQASALEDATERFHVAETQNQQLTIDLITANANIQDLKRNFELERMLTNELAEQKHELTQKIEQERRIFSDQLSELSRNDEIVNDWASAPVPDSVVRLLIESNPDSYGHKSGNPDPRNSSRLTFNPRDTHPFDS